MSLSQLVRDHHCDGVSPEELGKITQMQHTVLVRYRGVRRKSGGPVTDHFFCVQDVLATLGFGTIAELVGLGHDLLEDDAMTIAEIRETFGKWIAICIRALSKRPEDHGNYEVYASRMLRAVRYGFWQVIVAKLADHLHNLRTLDGFISRDRQREYLATTTRGIIFPLAEACRPWVEIHAPDKLVAYDDLCAMLKREYRIQCRRLGIAA
jgi:guanosine-3',5'-bis(diphosphate) 3'-pyrophosphohydrolase